jgi:hypothetical protein
MSIDHKLVPLGHTAKDLRIVQDQTFTTRARTLTEKQSGRQARKPASHNDAIVDLTRLGDFGWKLVKLPISNRVSALDHRLRVSGRALVVALAGVTGQSSPSACPPSRCLGAERKRAGRSGQYPCGAHEHAVQEITPRNGLPETKNLIEMGTVTHGVYVITRVGVAGLGQLG